MEFKISPSSISLMEECPRCFWLDKHYVWKRPSGIFPSLPSGMDGILKKHFNKFRDRNLLPPELCNNNECDNMELFGRNEDEKELLKTWQNNLKGIKWEDKKGNILSGAIDNLLVKNNRLIVLDYKTRGYKLKENTQDYYKNQLDIYNLLLLKNGFMTEEYSFLLFYVPSEVTETGEVVFDTTLKKITVNIKNAEMLFEKALKILQDECPDKKCSWCENIIL